MSDTPYRWSTPLPYGPEEYQARVRAILMGALASIDLEYGDAVSLATSEGRKLLAEVLVEKGWRWKDGIIE